MPADLHDLAAASAAVSGTPTAATGLTLRREFLWKVHAYINEYIRFADIKAGFCLGIASALIGTLFKSGSHELFIRAAMSQGAGIWSAPAILSSGAFAFLAASIGAAIAVVLPRLWINSLKGFVFWRAISEFDTAQGFAYQFASQSEDELNLHLALHLYSLAKICRRKYIWVSVAILTALAGGVLAVVVLLLKR
jgi:hypothetical protein